MSRRRMKIDKEALLNADEASIENMIDIRIRDKKLLRFRLHHEMYLQHWINVGNIFGCAGMENNPLGKFEILFANIIKRLILAERELVAINKIISGEDIE